MTAADGGGTPEMLGLALQAVVCGRGWLYAKRTLARFQRSKQRWLGCTETTPTARSAGAEFGQARGRRCGALQDMPVGGLASWEFQERVEVLGHELG
mgnify:CR=1 FL=1